MSIAESLSCGQPRGQAFVNLNAASTHYNRDAFEQGLEAAGYSIRRGFASPIARGDLLVLWNRYRQQEQLARDYEYAGATVLIAENGYLGPDVKPPANYALARGHHNGAGAWHVGQNARQHMLDIEVRPWRKDGDHIVIIPQRGMGEPGVKMHAEWPLRVEARLRKITKRPIVVRPHPGPRPHTGGMPELEGAWAAVTWASGGGIKAIAAGIPVFYEFPKWIGADAARFGIGTAEAPLIEAPYLGPTGTMFRKLSWAQWSVDEIRSGEAFKWLLSSS